MSDYLFDCVQLFLKGTERGLSGGTITSVVITGMVVVFLGLVLLILLVFGYGKLFDFIDNKKDKRARKKLEKMLAQTVDNTSEPSSITAPPVIEDGIDDEVVAVITAAIAALSTKSGKKLKLRSVKTAKPSRPVWANAGIIDNTRPF